MAANPYYVASDIVESARDFIEAMDSDVRIFFICRQNNYIPPDREADEFAAWWDLRRYEEHPRSLIFLYERHSYFLEQGIGDMQDAFMCLAGWMHEYYNLLVELVVL